MATCSTLQRLLHRHSALAVKAHRGRPAHAQSSGHVLGRRPRAAAGVPSCSCCFACQGSRCGFARRDAPQPAGAGGACHSLKRSLLQQDPEVPVEHPLEASIPRAVQGRPRSSAGQRAATVPSDTAWAGVAAAIHGRRSSLPQSRLRSVDAPSPVAESRLGRSTPASPPLECRPPSAGASSTFGLNCVHWPPPSHPSPRETVTLRRTLEFARRSACGGRTQRARFVSGKPKLARRLAPDFDWWRAG